MVKMILGEKPKGTRMKAAVLTSYGGEEAIVYRKDVAIPKPGAFEVRVRVRSCALGDSDLQVRAGLLEDVASVSIPRVLGFDISGVVDSVSEQISDLDVGDEVCGMIPVDSVHGGCAEYAVVNRYALVKKPPILSNDEAAACLSPGLHAYSALHYVCHLQAGETILITNGASSRGHIAVQIASMWNARVFTTANTQEELSYLQGLPCKIARIIDTSTENLVETLIEETGGIGLDCIVECPSTANEALKLQKLTGAIEDTSSVELMTPLDAIKLLSAHGRWVPSNNQLQLDPPLSRVMAQKSIVLGFAWENTWLLSMTQQGRYLHILSDLVDQIASEKIRVKVSSVHSLDKIRAALRQLETNTIGRVVVSVE